MNGVRGFLPILGAISGLVVWAAHFLVIYGAQATACVRLGAGHRLFGQPLVPTMVLGITAVALLVLAAIGFGAWRRLRSGLAGEEGEDATQFTPWLTLAIALLSALAIVWEAVPVLMLRPCG